MIIFISADLLQSSNMLAYICNPPMTSNPADSNQPLLRYLATSHPAVCNLQLVPTLQSDLALLHHPTRLEPIFYKARQAC